MGHHRRCIADPTCERRQAHVTPMHWRDVAHAISGDHMTTKAKAKVKVGDVVESDVNGLCTVIKVGPVTTERHPTYARYGNHRTVMTPIRMTPVLMRDTTGKVHETIAEVLSTD